MSSASFLEAARLNEVENDLNGIRKGNVGLGCFLPDTPVIVLGVGFVDLGKGTAGRPISAAAPGIDDYWGRVEGTSKPILPVGIVGKEFGPTVAVQI